MLKPFDQIFESFSSVMELLRDKEFQDLLVHYERAKKVFLVGYEIKDNVESEILFEADGHYGLKPMDYLLAFSNFVKIKANEIEAISILLNKPKDWSTKALVELKQKLRENSYDEENLKKAHKIVYHREAVDIISMIKHAAKETEPLLSPEERVNLAIKRVIEGKQLSYDQHKWIGFIKEHLKTNLSLDLEDFKEQPVLADRGGLKNFKKAFPEDFDTLIKEINIAIAA